MHSAIGRKVTWRGKEYRVHGMSPEGSGMAATISRVGEGGQYFRVNTQYLKIVD